MDPFPHAKKKLNYLFFLLLLILIEHACTCYSAKLPGDITEKNVDLATPKKIIFILHGLWQGVTVFSNTKQRLLDAFQTAGLAVEVRLLPEIITDAKSISEQACDAFEAIKSQLSSDDDEIILLGHSQGGLRAANILLLSERAEKPLNIKGLVTMATPWEGTPAAAITKSSVISFLHKEPVHSFLQGVTYVRPASAEFISTDFINEFFDAFPTHEPGVQDMVPASVFLQELATGLITNRIPILAIAGEYREVASFIPPGENTQEPYFVPIQGLPGPIVNNIYARIFAGGFHVQHDLVVPVYSQLAKHVAHNFERCMIPGAVHDFVPGLHIPIEKVIYNQSQVIERIVKFVKSNFDFNEKVFA